MFIRHVGITVVVGLPGAGKTTLAAHLLRHCNSHRLGLVKAAPELIDITQRCALERQRGVDYLLVESDGAAEPLALTQMLTGSGMPPGDPAERWYIDTLLAVVDATSLVEDFGSYRMLTRPFEGTPEAKPVAEIVAQYIECADVIVLTHVDKASTLSRQNARQLIGALNPAAPIFDAAFGVLPVEEAVATRRFHAQRNWSTEEWIRARTGALGLARDGISSVVYRARRPLHPERFMDLLRSPWPGVVRSRGFFWLATRFDMVGELTQAGSMRRSRAAGEWLASVLRHKTVDAAQLQDLTGLSWDPMFGDRRQELAFVGIDMNADTIRMNLDRCLLTDAEFRRGPEYWQGLPDPFPSWSRLSRFDAEIFRH